MIIFLIAVVPIVVAPQAEVGEHSVVADVHVVDAFGHLRAFKAFVADLPAAGDYGGECDVFDIAGEQFIELAGDGNFCNKS